MNAQDLKNNREEIIEKINDYCVAGSARAVMTEMLNKVNNGDWASWQAPFFGLEEEIEKIAKELEVAKFQNAEYRANLNTFWAKRQAQEMKIMYN